MFGLFKNELDRKYLFALIIIILFMKIAGSLFVNYYAHNNKTSQGMLFRDEKVLNDNKLAPTLIALGYHWDSIHYVNTSIMWEEHFKKAGQLRNSAYFYPIMIMIGSWIFRNSIFTAVLISNIFSILTILAFYHLCRIYMIEKKSFAASLLLAAYPSYFATGLIAYSEPVFLFFAVLSWYYYEKENYLLSALFAAMSLGSRVSGAIILPAYFLAFFYRLVRDTLKNKRLTLPSFSYLWYLIPLGVLLIQCIVTSKFVAMTGIRTDSFQGLLPTMDNHYLPISWPSAQWKYFSQNIGQGLEFYMYLAPAFLLALYLKKFRVELAIFAVLAFVYVICISKPEVIRAIPRHILNMWPIFISLGDLVINRYFLIVVTIFFFIGGLKTLDFYFTCCYI